MKDLINRIAQKLSGHKAMFTIAVLAVICFIDLTPTNASVLEKLIFAVLGAKMAEYGMHALKARRGGGED